MQIFRVNSVFKLWTLKQQLNDEKLDVGYIPAFGWAVLCCFGVQSVSKTVQRRLVSQQDGLCFRIPLCSFWCTHYFCFCVVFFKSDSQAFSPAASATEQSVEAEPRSRSGLRLRPCPLLQPRHCTVRHPVPQAEDSWLDSLLRWCRYAGLGSDMYVHTYRYICVFLLQSMPALKQAQWQQWVLAVPAHTCVHTCTSTLACTHMHLCSI